MERTMWTAAVFLSVTGLGARADGDGATFDFPELGLAITLPELEGLTQGDPEPGEETALVAWWNGELDGAAFAVGLSVFDAASLGLREPGDVTERIVVLQQGGPLRFVVREQQFTEGPYGCAPFASLVVADVALPDETAFGQRHYVLGGLLPGRGYALHVTCEPSPDERQDESIRAFLAEGVWYDGPLRDPEWSDEEVLERWLASTPEALHADFVRAMRKRSTAKRVRIRTDNYLIMTNSSGGKLFARKMEENYDEIAELFPFEEVEGRRLMPVFLFQTQQEFWDFYVEDTGGSYAQARRTKGYAWKDLYATWYESPNDPVHVHEQVHQIFRNRLRLRGGGSWFQEGVAEYVEGSENDRNVVARLVRDGEATPLGELVALRSLLHSSGSDVRGGSRAGDNYREAALLIEFLRESRFGAEHFGRFLRVMGKVPRNDVDAIEAAFRQVYGTGIDGVEAAWRAYCEDRR